MTTDNYKELIIGLVNGSNGLKGVELCMKVMERINPTRFSLEQHSEALDTLRKSGDIVELEFRIPGINYVKSMFFPKGTTFLFMGTSNVRTTYDHKKAEN